MTPNKKKARTRLLAVWWRICEHYMGHSDIGHSCIGQSYISLLQVEWWVCGQRAHNYVGRSTRHNYVGHKYRGHNYIVPAFFLRVVVPRVRTDDAEARAAAHQADGVVVEARRLEDLPHHLSHIVMAYIGMANVVMAQVRQTA